MGPESALQIQSAILYFFLLIFKLSVTINFECFFVGSQELIFQQKTLSLQFR